MYSCKRTAHYGCLEPVQFLDAETTMSNHTLSYYKDGVCHDCHKFDDLWSVQLDVILGWRESEKASRALTGEKVRDRKTGKDYVLPNAKDLTSPAEVRFSFIHALSRPLENIPLISNSYLVHSTSSSGKDGVIELVISIGLNILGSPLDTKASSPTSSRKVRLSRSNNLKKNSEMKKNQISEMDLKNL